MTNKNNISLVMIAKNEELGLEKAVDSCRPFVDEVIILVDQASTDKTLEVAKKCADRAAEYKWEGSFSKAKNLARKFAKTEWIVYLDGHEYVQSWDKLKEMLEKDIDALFVKIIMENGFTFYYPRIVKTKIEWQHAVHNTPKSKRNMKYEDFIIVHDRITGQTEEGARIRKEQRDKMVVSELGPEAKKIKKIPGRLSI